MAEELQNMSFIKLVRKDSVKCKEMLNSSKR